MNKTILILLFCGCIQYGIQAQPQLTKGYFKDVYVNDTSKNDSTHFEYYPDTKMYEFDGYLAYDVFEDTSFKLLSYELLIGKCNGTGIDSTKYIYEYVRGCMSACTSMERDCTEPYGGCMSWKSKHGDAWYKFYRVTYEINSHGDEIRYTRHFIDGDFAGTSDSSTCSYIYDDQGRILEKRFFDIPQKLSSSFTCIYAADYKKTETFDRDEKLTGIKEEIFENGKLTIEQFYDGCTKTKYYSYNAKGFVTEVKTYIAGDASQELKRVRRFVYQ